MNRCIAQHPLVRIWLLLKKPLGSILARSSLAEGLPYVGLTEQDVQDAHARLSRFALSGKSIS